MKNLNFTNVIFRLIFTAICVLIALFLHPFGWGHGRVQRLCGADSEAFWPADCTLGNLFFPIRKCRFCFSKMV